MSSNYPPDMDWNAYDRAFGGKDYDSPEPDDVRKAAHELAPKVAAFIESEMRKSFPDFYIGYNSKPNPIEYLKETIGELAYEYQSDCEREREQ